MTDQFSLFDAFSENTSSGSVVTNVPSVNSEGFIPADQLVPEKWEAWKYSDDNATLSGGRPYIIDAVVALLPGNRLYVKEWMLYPFMFEYSSPAKAEKKYLEYRQKIVERKQFDRPGKRTWQVSEMPPLKDMWQFADGEYSCCEYASTMLHGYRASFAANKEVPA